MKQWKVKGSVILFAALLLLIFFSKTIYSAQLPRVTASLPKKGALEKSLTVSGVAQYGEERSVYLPVTGKVESLHVTLGESVAKGDLLATMNYDTKETSKQLAKNHLSNSEIYNSIKGVELDIQQLEREIEYLENPEEPVPEQDTQLQLDMLRLDIRAASAHLKEQRRLHEAGEIEDSVLERARYDIQKLYLQEEDLVDKIKREKDKREKDFVKEEKDHEKTLLDKKDQLAKQQLQLNQHNLNLSSLGLDSQTFYGELEDYSQYKEIISPVDGIVTKLEGSLGETLNGAQKLMDIGVTGSLELQVPIPLDNDFIAVGDWCKIQNANHTLEGQVKHIETTSEDKKVTISLEEGRGSSGETFTAEFKKRSDTSYTLVPNSALGKDKDGYFINYVRQRKGIVGQEYYLAKIRVEIGERDATHTAILKGIDFYEPVATESNKALVSGGSIFLENEKEFFDEQK